MLSKKYFWGWWTKFFRAAGASDARRGEGPHRPIRKPPQGFVHVLRGLAAAEAAENRFLLDFSDSSIFDFFDSIDPEPTCGRMLGSDQIGSWSQLALPLHDHEPRRTTVSCLSVIVAGSRLRLIEKR